jgi:hypothetical protein
VTRPTVRLGLRKKLFKKKFFIDWRRQLKERIPSSQLWVTSNAYICPFFFHLILKIFLFKFKSFSQKIQWQYVNTALLQIAYFISFPVQNCTAVPGFIGIAFGTCTTAAAYNHVYSRVNRERNTPQG